MNIVYTLNDKFVPQVGASICSLLENNKSVKEINIYLISKGITKSNKSKLKDFVKKYNRNISIIELQEISSYFDFNFDTTGWNEIVLARLLLDKLLPKNMEKILYLDGDTIVRRNLSELWDIDLKNNVFGMSIEPTYDKSRKASIGLSNKPYYNAGVLLINLMEWRRIDASKTILKFYKDHDGKLFANDQDAINGSMKNYIYTISPSYNFYNIFYQYNYNFLNKLMSPVKYISENTFKKAVDNPHIIHYLGEERPWRRGNHHKYKKDYIKYLSKTPWANQGIEKGWEFYFICWYIFNFIMKPFPNVRYKIINILIPKFMKFRSKKNKK